jgi:hypothetical protein
LHPRALAGDRATTSAKRRTWRNRALNRTTARR